MNTFRRVVVAAPSRAAAVNIRETISNGNIPTPFLVEKCRDEIRDAVENLHLGGFGILAGTGTGKTVSIRYIANMVLQEELEVGIVTREHEDTKYTKRCKVLVVTSGIARNWLISGKITKEDLIFFDEIHQTSSHLELVMALAKRIGCTFIWLSATVDSQVYEKYLNSRTVIRCEDFDPSKVAKVHLVRENCQCFLTDMLPGWIEGGRGVVVFVPTRRMAENLVKTCSARYGEQLYCGFYHGGRKIDEIEKILRGEIPKPFVIFMTVAGASSLNVPGLNTVIIIDEIFEERVRSGVRILERGILGPNHLLQMGGRVNGRAEDGQIFVLTERDIDFHSLKPVSPRFVLGGDLRQTALTCARIGVDVSELELISGIDLRAYRREFSRLQRREIISHGGLLTPYGKVVENIPVDSSWGEMIAHALERDKLDLLNLVITVSCIEDLRSLLGLEPKVESFRIEGSDHLTSYEIIRRVLTTFGYLEENEDGVVVYKLREGFTEWCDNFGFSERETLNTLLAMKSVYHQLEMELPEVSCFKHVPAESNLAKSFIRLLATVQSLDLSYKKENPRYGRVLVAGSSVVDWQSEAIIGSVKMIDFGEGRGPQAYIEGTVIPEWLVKENIARNGLVIFDGIKFAEYRSNVQQRKQQFSTVRTNRGRRGRR